MNPPAPGTHQPTVWEEVETGKHAQHPDLVPLSDLAERTVLVTGGNKGIGLECVLGLARLQGKAPKRIIIASRSAANNASAIERVKRETGYDRVESRELDLMDLSAVKAFAVELPAIDILINNAGFQTRKFVATKDGLESTVQVNCVSPLLLTLLLLPRMQAGARVVFVASTYQESLSGLPTSGSDVWRQLNSSDAEAHESLAMEHRYALSKWLDVATVEELVRLSPRANDVLFASACPGLCATDFAGDEANEFIAKHARPASMGARCVLWPAVHDGEGRLDKSTNGTFYADCKPRSVKQELRDDEAHKLKRELYTAVVGRLGEVHSEVRQVAGLA